MNASARTLGSVVSAFVLLGGLQGSAQQSLQVRVDRWLKVESITGKVNRSQGVTTQTAQVGDRLEFVGDSITTGKNSTSTLLIDTGVGSISLSENTRLSIQSLAFAPDNGRITRLEVTGGQARLRVRRFTHRGSQLEIRTPAGLSGVRGTDFGVNVQPNGKSGLAVSQGKVVSSAQGASIGVPAGFQNFTIPGEPPSTPTPLREDTRIQYHFRRVIQNGVRLVQLVGRVDPVNSVIVEGTPQSTDREGEFVTVLRPLPNSLTIRVVIITPLGKKQIHDLAYQ